MSAPMAMHSGGTLAAAVSAAGGMRLVRRHPRDRGARLGDGAGGAVRATHRSAVRDRVHHAVPRVRSTATSRPRSTPGPTRSRCRSPTRGAWLAGRRTPASGVICQVQTFADAELAVAAGADVLVAQGTEAGGHTGTMALLPFLAGVAERAPRRARARRRRDRQRANPRRRAARRSRRRVARHGVPRDAGGDRDRRRPQGRDRRERRRRHRVHRARTTSRPGCRGRRRSASGSGATRSPTSGPSARRSSRAAARAHARDRARALRPVGCVRRRRAPRRRRRARDQRGRRARPPRPSRRSLPRRGAGSTEAHGLGYERVDDDPNLAFLIATMDATSAWDATAAPRLGAGAAPAPSGGAATGRRVRIG